MANFYCPNCGSTDVNKSIGGKVEHAAAYGGVKLVKHFLGIGIPLGEGEIIKEEVPFQQVCNYCHHTFHARKSQIDAGAYSMTPERAKLLMNAYNAKLQKVKDKEVKELHEKTKKALMCLLFSICMAALAIVIFFSCDLTTEAGWFGLKTPNFLGVIDFILALWGILGTISSISFYSDALSNEQKVKNMTIQQYAKEHSA